MLKFSFHSHQFAVYFCFAVIVQNFYGSSLICVLHTHHIVASSSITINILNNSIFKVHHYYRIYSRISRKINDKIMPQKLGGGRLIAESILARRLDLLLRLSWNVIIAH